MEIIIYLVSLMFLLTSTRNIFSFSVLYALLLMLPTLYAQPEVKKVMLSGIFFMSIGHYLTHLLIFRAKTRSFIINARNTAPTQGTFNKNTLRFGIALAILIASVGSLYYFKKVGISLFADEVGLSRLQQRHAVPGSYFYQRLFRVVLPIMVLVCAGYIITQKRTLINASMLIFLCILTSLFLVFTGIRGNIVTFLFFPLVIFMGLYTKHVTIKNVSYLIILTTSVVLYATFAMYKRLGIDADVILLAGLVFERLTQAATDGIEHAILVDVPKHGLYLGSLYIQDFLSLLTKLGLINGDYANYSAQMAQEMLGERYNGEAAAVFVFGEFYANFGFLGNVFASIILGGLLQAFYIFTTTQKKTIFRMAISSYFSAALISILGGPSFSMLIDYTVVCLILYIMFRVFISVPNLFVIPRQKIKSIV